MADWDIYIKRSEAAKQLADPIAEVIAEVVSNFEKNVAGVDTRWLCGSGVGGFGVPFGILANQAGGEIGLEEDTDCSGVAGDCEE